MIMKSVSRRGSRRISRAISFTELHPTAKLFHSHANVSTKGSGLEQMQSDERLVVKLGSYERKLCEELIFE